jgi:uncharacterized tellurite resistance protein B-like protein
VFDRVLGFLTGDAAPSSKTGIDEFELAVAALLIEAARMDDSFGAAERATIERLLTERFALSADELTRLIEVAERAVRDATQLFPFTQQVCKRMSPESRVQIVEMLWKVAYADGVLDPEEDMLVRRIAGLIYVSDRERGEARQRAIASLPLKKP